jgi:hypothetical protein
MFTSANKQRRKAGGAAADGSYSADFADASSDAGPRMNARTDIEQFGQNGGRRARLRG